MSSLCCNKERTLSGSACCLHALMSEMPCRTQFGAMLTRLSKQHPGVAEWAKNTSCASKSRSQAHKLRIWIGESPSLSLSKPKNFWLVADMIWSAVSGLSCRSTQSCGQSCGCSSRTEGGSARLRTNQLQPLTQKPSAQLICGECPSCQTPRPTSSNGAHMLGHGVSFGRTVMVIFIDEPVMWALACPWSRWSGVCLDG